MKRIVVLSDMQIPLHNRKAIDTVIKFVKDYQPDELFCVGDEADCLAPARWSKGYAAEYSNLQRDLDESHLIMKRFREALGDKPFHLMRSNHGDRIERYVKRYAPALATLRELSYHKLMGYDKLKIDWHDKLWNFAPGWIMGHGDELSDSASSNGGGNALKLAKKTGMSVVCGHTHKMGILHSNQSYNGKLTKSLYGFEVGNMMNLKKATYLKGGSGNWQSGFGMFYVHERKVTPVPIMMLSNSFVVEGQVYSW